MTDPTPRPYAVVGHPVAHSQSPFIHAAFARQTGQAVSYGRIDCGPDGFEAAVRAFAAAGRRWLQHHGALQVQKPASSPPG